MNIYLPIAETTVNILSILALGGIIGFFSGLYGIGGGIISTPLLILYGINPAIAVGTASVQILSSGFSRTLRNMRDGHVDFSIAFIMFIGGMVGSSVGAYILNYTNQIGVSSILICAMYSVVMSMLIVAIVINIVKSLVTNKSINNEIIMPEEVEERGVLSKFSWFARKSFIAQTDYNVVGMLCLGVVVGAVGAIMGVGGAVICVPALMIFLKMTMRDAAATGLLQTVLVAVNIAVLQTLNGNVDIVLALIIITSSSITVHIGSKASIVIKKEIVQASMAVVASILLAKFLITLFKEPASKFFVE